MIILPEISQQVIPRPGSHDFEVPYLIPKKGTSVFWKKIYKALHDMKFTSPVSGGFKRYLTPDIGYFGLRPHPTGKPGPYFHIGVQMSFPKVREIYPIASGILEYAGYGAINGHYVLLSHPDIVTKDGYVLHSMYCHLKKPMVGFSSYQKMLREISLGSYPVIPVTQDTPLGISGNSGVIENEKPKLYLQLDFRKYGEVPIVIDPFPIFTGEHHS